MKPRNILLRRRMAFAPSLGAALLVAGAFVGWLILAGAQPANAATLETRSTLVRGEYGAQTSGKADHTCGATSGSVSGENVVLTSAVVAKEDLKGVYVQFEIYSRSRGISGVLDSPSKNHLDLDEGDIGEFSTTIDTILHPGDDWTVRCTVRANHPSIPFVDETVSAEKTAAFTVGPMTYENPRSWLSSCDPSENAQRVDPGASISIVAIGRAENDTTAEKSRYRLFGHLYKDGEKEGEYTWSRSPTADNKLLFEKGFTAPESPGRYTLDCVLVTKNLNFDLLNRVKNVQSCQSGHYVPAVAACVASLSLEERVVWRPVWIISFTFCVGDETDCPGTSPGADTTTTTTPPTEGTTPEPAPVTPAPAPEPPPAPAPAPPSRPDASCISDLGNLSGTAVNDGQWTGACGSSNEEDHYARYFTFSLDQSADVSIELHSSEVDTYLYLMSDPGTDGEILFETLDYTSSSSPRTQIQETLDRGIYTIEAGPWDIETGGFTLVVRRLDAVSETPWATYSRNEAEDLNGLTEADNSDPEGIWSDGTTMWVADDDEDKIFAYNLITGARDAAKDFNTLESAENERIRGVWSDGTTMWVADNSDDRIYAYSMTTKGRVPSRDFEPDTGDTEPDGIWSDRTTMWVAGEAGRDSIIYAFRHADKARDLPKEFSSLEAAGNDYPTGIWSDGTTMWVADYRDDKVYAYDMTTKGRIPSRDIDLLKDAGNEDPYGMWSNGATLWVSDERDGKIYAYSCLLDLGEFAGTLSTAGDWIDGCASTSLPDRDAGHYSFSIAQETDLEIRVLSVADSRLYLRSGKRTAGPALHQDAGANPILRQKLSAGSYSVEVVPSSAGGTGSFTLTLSPSSVGAPGAPTIGAVTAQGASLLVPWSAATGPGASAATSYNLRHIRTDAADKADANWTPSTVSASPGSGAMSYRLQDLEAQTAYDLQGQAVNDAGSSPWSASVSATTGAAVRVSWISCLPSRPLPGATVSCTPSVTGGVRSDDSYAWLAEGGSPSDGSGRNFSTSWDSMGPKRVAVEACSAGDCASSQRTVAVADPNPNIIWDNAEPPAEIALGDSIDLWFEIIKLSVTGVTGGISVSFPNLTQRSSTGSLSSYESGLGTVETISFSGGSSGVTYRDSASRPGIPNADGTQGTPRHLTVTAETSNWPRSFFIPTGRTLRLRATPRETGEFRILYRFWLCTSDRQNCVHRPLQDGEDIRATDQQGWAAFERTVNVLALPVIDGIFCTPAPAHAGDAVACSPVLSGSAPSTYAWNAGNALAGGSPHEGTGATFSTTWDYPGRHRVTLEACNVAGCATAETFVTVNVGDSVPPTDPESHQLPGPLLGEDGGRVLYSGPVSGKAHSQYTTTDTILQVKILPTSPVPTLQITIYDEDGFASGSASYVSPGVVVLALPEDAWVDYARIATEMHLSGFWAPYTKQAEAVLLAVQSALSAGPPAASTTLGLAPAVGMAPGPALTASDHLSLGLGGVSDPPVNEIFGETHANCVSQVTVPWLTWATQATGVRVSIPLSMSRDAYASLAAAFTAAEPGATGGEEPALAQLHDLLATGEDSPECMAPELEAE